MGVRNVMRIYTPRDRRVTRPCAQYMQQQTRPGTAGCSEAGSFWRILAGFAPQHKAAVALFFLLTLVQPLRNVLIPHILGKMYERVKSGRTFGPLLLASAAVVLISQFAWIVSDVVEISIKPALQKYVANAIVAHVLAVHSLDLQEVETSDVIARTMDLPHATMSLVSSVKSDVLPTVLSFVAVFAYLVFKHPVLGAGLGAALTASFIGVFAWLRHCSPRSVQCNVQRLKFMEHLDDVLRNMRAVVGLRTTGAELRGVNEALRRNWDACESAFRCTMSAKYFVIPVMLAYLFWAATYGYGLMRAGRLSNGDMVTLLVIGFFVNNAVFSLTDVFEDVVNRWALVQNSLSVFSTCHANSDQLRTAETPAPRDEHDADADADAVASEQRKAADAGVYVWNVWYRDILRGTTLYIPPNSVSLVVGEVGSGKSTLLDVLLGHKQPSSGFVLHGGRRAGDQAAARAFYIPQTPVMFNRTVYENIVYGLHGSAVPSREEVLARIHAFDAAYASTEATLGARLLRDLPAGLDSQVGLRGSKLSGGQRQLVWLSKLLFLSPDIDLVIMDEPTASLDVLSKTLVADLILHAAPGRTVVMVTHDDRLLQLADQTVRMERGRVRDIAVRKGGNKTYTEHGRIHRR